MDSRQSAIDETLAAALARSQNIAEIDVGRDVLKKAGKMCRRHFDADTALVFADEAAFAAAGDAAVAGLRAAGLKVELHILPTNPQVKPNVALASDFAARLGDGTVPVALGSGVMNDLVKFAAFQKGLRYFSIATAASMDGYCSGGAPLIRDGFKITIACRAPKAILADLEVLASAPRQMTAWGYGDLAGKVAAGGDWLIADALGIEPLDDVSWPLVQGNLGGFLAGPEDLARGDIGATARLFTGLSLCGLAMEFHGTSRPASGADHQIAHMWEMEELTHRGGPVAHGACVAVGTTTVLALYDWLIKQDLSALDIPATVARMADWQSTRAQIHVCIPSANISERAVREMGEKYIAGEALEARLRKLKDIWPDLRLRVSGHLMRNAEMKRHLRAAGSVCEAADIGVTAEQLKATVYASRFIRERYTILDLLAETGLLEEAVETTLPDGVLQQASGG